MKILEQLKSQHDGNIAAVGRSLGQGKVTTHKWFKVESIPVDHWDNVCRLLPKVSIEDCYQQFVRDRRKQTNVSKDKPKGN